MDVVYIICESEKYSIDDIISKLSNGKCGIVEQTEKKLICNI